MVFYTIFFLFLLSPLLLQRVEPMWDAADMGYPALTYATDSLREGRMPLWDPYTGCGFPFHAVPGGGTLDPLTFLIAFTCSDGFFGFVVFWLFYWWWAGIGMFFMARSFKAGPAGALVSALAYAFSGFFLSHAEHTGFIVTAAWLPWVFGLADRAVADSKLHLALLAGVAAGIATLSGYPGLNAFMGLALALWLLLRHLPEQNPAETSAHYFSKKTLRIALTLVIIAVVMIAVWSPILHSFFTEGKGYTDRISALAPDISNFADAFSLQAAVSLFFPFSTIIGFGKFIPGDISMTNAYMGMLTIPLAVLWFLKGNGNRRPWWMVVFVLFTFVVSLGGHAGLRTLLYYIYPPMRYMRFSAPFRIFWIMPLCLGAGLGFSHFSRQPADRRFFFKIFIGWVVAASVAALYVTARLASSGVHVTEFFTRLFLPGILSVVLSGAMIRLWSKSSRKGLDRVIPVLLLLVFSLDLAAAFHYNSMTIYNDGDVVRRIESFHKKTTLISGEPQSRVPGMPVGFTNFQQVTKIPVVEGYVNMRSKGFNDILCKSRFADIMSKSPRFWVSPGVAKPTLHADVLAILSQTGSGDPVPVFVEDAASPIADIRVVPGSYGKTRIFSYAPENIEMSVSVPGDKGGFLASTERYASGWKAWVDGVPQKIWKTNLYFRGIFVPAGEHVVIWKYEPMLFKPLAILSYATIFIMICAALLMMKQRNK